MAEKVHVEFTVSDKDKFLAQLNDWTGMGSDMSPAVASSVIGYRADDYVSRRAALVSFVDAMEAKLRKNEHKSNWREKPIDALFRLMMLEVEEFKVALEFFAVEEARPELVDVANFALIVWDRLGMLPHQNRQADLQDTTK